MATVRLSQTLINEILDIAGAAHQKSITRAMESRPSNDWAEKIYNTLFGDEITLVEKVPGHWFAMIMDFRLTFVAGLDCGNMKFSFATPKRWPQSCGVTNPHGKFVYAGSVDIVLYDDPVWEELRAEIAAWRGRVTAARAREHEFRASIRKILNSYTTLAPALKAWPPLWDYLPEAVKTKHKEISTKEKKAEVVVDVDLSTLTAMAVAAKIG